MEGHLQCPTNYLPTATTQFAQCIQVSGKEHFLPIQTLVIHNVENLRWATLQNIDAAFRVFSRELDEELAHTIEATYGAIEAAYTRRKEHADEIADGTQKLQKASGDLQTIIDALTPARSSKV